MGKRLVLTQWAYEQILQEGGRTAECRRYLGAQKPHPRVAQGTSQPGGYAAWWGKGDGVGRH